MRWVDAYECDVLPNFIAMTTHDFLLSDTICRPPLAGGSVVSPLRPS